MVGAGGAPSKRWPGRAAFVTLLLASPWAASGRVVRGGYAGTDAALASPAALNQPRVGIEVVRRANRSSSFAPGTIRRGVESTRFWIEHRSLAATKRNETRAYSSIVCPSAPYVDYCDEPAFEATCWACVEVGSLLPVCSRV